jgi:hypothetical protein
LLTEKIAEAAQNFATLQSDLSTSVAAEAVPATGGVASGTVRRRGKRHSLLKGGNSGAVETVHKSMHDVKLAFSEFYLSLILLQNYQTLNFTGFRKILKKHDKVYSCHTCTLKVLHTSLRKS